MSKITKTLWVEITHLKMKGQNTIEANKQANQNEIKKEKQKDCQIGKENKEIWRIL